MQNGATRRFDDLDGCGFEALIKRRYQGAGYTARSPAGRVIKEATARPARGCQEGHPSEASSHMSVGNDAVQQVVAAKAIDHCPAAVVITNSTFTPEAEELARVHGVELVDGNVLRMRLQETSGESWA